jgi:hypothetical protein
MAGTVMAIARDPTHVRPSGPITVELPPQPHTPLVPV